MAKKTVIYSVICKDCGREINTTYKRKLFCNNSCKSNWHNAENKRLKELGVLKNE